MNMLSVVQAILLLGGKYVLQLRDDKPGIAAPNQWAFFGGSVEAGESAMQAVVREIHEELTISPQFKFQWPFEAYSAFVRNEVRYLVFSASVDDLWYQHRVLEGQDACAYSYEEAASLGMPRVTRQILHRFHLEHPLAL